jgi:hypothetical protein
MRNRQTCTVGDLHLVLAGVAVLDVHPSHVVGEVVGGAGIEEPGLILLVGGVPGARALRLKGLVEAVLALEGLMPPVFADLAARTLAAIAAAAPATALATSTVTATTAPLVGAVATLALLLLLLATGSMAASRRPGRATAGATAIGVGEGAPPPTRLLPPCRAMALAEVENSGA